MKTSVIGPFKGIDRRRNAAVSLSDTLRRALNVEITLGGAIKRRDALRLYATVSENSYGLYASNGGLHAVVPGGQSLQETRPATITYDPIGDGSAYDLTAITKLWAVESIGSSAVVGAFPYVVIERDDGSYEHHWLTSAPADGSTAVSTKVALPFDPGKVLIKAAAKLFADDPTSGVLRFSAAVTGPTDWTTARDAGELAVRQYIAGAREIRAMGYFKDMVAVQFSDATQLWRFTPDPSTFQLVTVLNGPGTEAPGATANVLGDMLSFSRGGFRSLALNSVTGEVRDDDIGADVFDLTQTLDTTSVVSVWSQSRSQYICAFGTDVWVLTKSSRNKLEEWTRWTLPVPVEYLVEHDGELYIRSGTSVYIFDPDLDQDFGTTDVNFDVLTAFQDVKAPAMLKRWNSVDLVQTGRCSVNYLIETDDEDELLYEVATNVNGVTFAGGKIGISTISDALALRFTGARQWRLDSLMLHYDVLRGAG